VRLERSVETSVDDETIRERVTAFFAIAGYQESVSQPHVMSFRRGKFFALTAKGSPVNAVIQIGKTADQRAKVLVALEVDTTGQFVVESEREYWREQLDGIEKAIQGEEGK
jgi:hypothetical protein